jgi:exopolysaccharide biosynthesis polyprenyl glycosylphosphotransferase
VFPGHHRRLRILYGVADLILIALAFQLAYWVRTHLELAHDFALDGPVAIALLVWSMFAYVASASWWEIYDRIDGRDPRSVLIDAFQQCLVGSVAVVLFEFMWRLELSRSFVALFAFLTWLLFCLFRLNAGRILGAVRREFGTPHYVMVVGLGSAAQRLGRQFEDVAAPHGIHLLGFFADAPAADIADANDPELLEEIQLRKPYPVHPIGSLPEMLRSHVIDEIVFATESRRLADLEDVLLICDEEGVQTRIAVDFFPHVNSRMHLERLGTSPLLTFSATPHDELRLLVKRITDIVLAFAMLALLAVPMMLLVLIIRLTSPGPAIFRQERCGLNGRRFVFYKFRSMCEDAESMHASLQHLGHRELAGKIPNDPRLTPIGRWIRKFSVDEWPQLWNVIKGDMSLVGPRPAIPEEVEQYKRWQRRRLRMRPGLTCLWAVNGRDSVDFETWMKLDMQYIDNWSLALDWKIILRTIPAMLSGRGAH